MMQAMVLMMYLTVTYHFLNSLISKNAIRPPIITSFIIKIKNIYYIYTNNQPYTFIMKIFYIYYIAIYNIDLATILIISSLIKNKTTNN